MTGWITDAVDAVTVPAAEAAIGLWERSQSLFAKVDSVQMGSPVEARAAALAELRRYIATRRERHSENASRMREWADRVGQEPAGRGIG